MSIWQTLSRIDCSKHVEKKGNLSYLSWAWAWGTLMEHYPDAQYTIHDELQGDDGTVECRVTIRIDDKERMMWLPVMDNRNNAVTNPNKRQISDCRMRCLVKCLAMFGLGHYIYAGEDLPQSDPISKEELDTFMALVAGNDASGLVQYMRELGDDKASEAFNAAPQGEKVKLKNKVRELQGKFTAMVKEYVEQIGELANNGDPAALELTAELTEFEKHAVWAQLTDIQKRQISNLKEQAA